MRASVLFASATMLGLLAAPRAQAEAWDFSFTPYFWAAGLEGKMASIPALPVADVDLSFGDVLEELQFGVASKVEARRGRLGLIGDFSYVDTGVSADIASAEFNSAHVDSKTIMAAAAAAYRVADGPAYGVDVILGTRLSWVDTELNFGRPDGSRIEAKDDETWVDAYLGVRGEAALSDRWYVNGYADLGAGASDYTWQLHAALNYRINQSVALSGGYRQYRVDYDNNGFVYDISEGGPIFGALFQF